VTGLFTIFDVRGEELDQSAMMRYLNETTWFPIALLSDNMKWQGVDDHSADVTFFYCGKSVTARLFFGADGRLINFSAMRYRENKGKFSLDRWETPMTEWGALGGLNLPIGGQAVWKLPSGDLPYVNVKLIEVEYNRPISTF